MEQLHVGNNVIKELLQHLFDGRAIFRLLPAEPRRPQRSSIISKTLLNAFRSPPLLRHMTALSTLLLEGM